MRTMKKTHHSHLALLLIRVGLALIFIAHGYAKITSMPGTIGFFTAISIPWPVFTAYLVAYVEFLGGISLLLGVASRFSALLLAIDMIGAIITVHFKNGFIAQGGYEYAFILVLALISVIISGPGHICLWTCKHCKNCKDDKCESHCSCSNYKNN